jgi:hypothetical protein
VAIESTGRPASKRVPIISRSNALEHAKLIENRLFRNEAGNLSSQFASAKEEQRRNSPNSEALHERRRFVDVHLRDGEPAVVLGGKLIKHGGHQSTRATPWRPEIDKHRSGRFQHDCSKGLGTNGNCFVHSGCRFFAGSLTQRRQTLLSLAVIQFARDYHEEKLLRPTQDHKR